MGLDLIVILQSERFSLQRQAGWSVGGRNDSPKYFEEFQINPIEISDLLLMGLDRIVMDRFKIKDIRSLYNGDIKY